MFGRKKTKTTINQEQLELIQYAQKRIKQKKRFYTHLAVFVIFSLILIIFNVGLGLADATTILALPWSVFVTIIWLAILFWHFLNVFLLNRFMGKDWEQKQLQKLVSKQQAQIEKIKLNLEKEAPLIAQSEFYNQSKNQKNNLTIIAAAGKKNAIGKNNKLIWHLSDDLKRFKKLTSGHHIIMGRKTFESFPKPLPNRTHVVITRQKNYPVPKGVIVVNSLPEALQVVKADKQPFIIGGGEIYQQALPHANTIELTKVHHVFKNADTFFPEVNPSTWKEVNNIFHKKDAQNQYDFSFITYVKK